MTSEGYRVKKDARFALLAGDVRSEARSGRSRRAAAPRRSAAEPEGSSKEMRFALLA
jgi:hypothetical protein